jgi:hypothetical protein
MPSSQHRDDDFILIFTLLWLTYSTTQHVAKTVPSKFPCIFRAKSVSSGRRQHPRTPDGTVLATRVLARVYSSVPFK